MTTFAWISIGTVAVTLVMLVQTFRDASASKQVDADVIKAMQSHNDALIRFDRALAEAVASAPKPAPEPSVAAARLALEKVLAQWTAETQAPAFSHVVSKYNTQVTEMLRDARRDDVQPLRGHVPKVFESELGSLIETARPAKPRKNSAPRNLGVGLARTPRRADDDCAVA